MFKFLFAICLCVNSMDHDALANRSNVSYQIIRSLSSVTENECMHLPVVVLPVLYFAFATGIQYLFFVDPHAYDDSVGGVIKKDHYRLWQDRCIANGKIFCVSLLLFCNMYILDYFAIAQCVIAIGQVFGFIAAGIASYGMADSLLDILIARYALT